MAEEEVIAKVGIDTGDSGKKLEGVKQGIDDIGKTTETTAKQTPKLAKGIKGIGTSFKSIAAATGIVIVIQKAFEFLSEALQKNQKIADAISIVFDTISIVMNEVVNVLVNTYESVAKSSENFDALGKVMNGIITIALTPLKLSFFAIKLGIQELQLAWEKSPLGGGDKEKIAELTLGVTETKNAIEETALATIEAGKSIVTNFSEAVGEVGNITTQVVDGIKEIDVKSAASQAKSAKALENASILAKASLTGLVEENDRLAEKQRQIRDNENATFEERIAANEKIEEILNKQEKDMLALADLSIASAQADLNNLDNIENQVALQEALNEKKGIEAQITGFRSEQLTNQVGLEKELGEVKNQIAVASIGERERELLEVEQQYEELFRLAEKSGVDTTELEKKKADDITKIKTEHAKADAEINKAVAATDLQTMQGVTAGVKGLFGEQSAAGKIAGVIDATINTYVGASKAIAQGGILGPALAGITIASGLAQVKAIISTPKPEFAAGGLVGGGGTGTSDSVPSVLSKGESVINAKSTRMFKPLLSTINQAGGGRAFAGNEGSGGQTSGVIKAFVVADDMTNEQDKLTKIRRKATI
jgi:hypothetical protein|tara:strand:+ start:13867 stop:15651 length:1785 start_codon:yes stop_codon:yes gene_type:complete